MKCRLFWNDWKDPFARAVERVRHEIGENLYWLGVTGRRDRGGRSLPAGPGDWAMLGRARKLHTLSVELAGEIATLPGGDPRTWDADVKQIPEIVFGWGDPALAMNRAANTSVSVAQSEAKRVLENVRDLLDLEDGPEERSVRDTAVAAHHMLTVQSLLAGCVQSLETEWPEPIPTIPSQGMVLTLF